MSRLTIRNLIISTIFLATTLGVFGYGVFFVERANDGLREQITALEKSRAQEGAIRQLKRIAEESSADRELLNASFLDGEGESIDFLNLIETEARTSGLVFTTENLQRETEAGTGEDVLVFRFVYSGDYTTVVGFLEVIENLPYIAEITQFDLSGSSQGEWEARVTVQVNLYTYEN